MLKKSFLVFALTFMCIIPQYSLVKASAQGNKYPNLSNLEENRIGIVYDAKTGDIVAATKIPRDGFTAFVFCSEYEPILDAIGSPPLAQAYPSMLENYGFASLWLDNYLNREEIFENIFGYIFDLELEIVREKTNEEINVALECINKVKEMLGSSVVESRNLLPDNRIFVTLSWSGYINYIETTSAIFGVTFDSEQKQLYIAVGGESGTIGEVKLTISKELVPSPEDIKVCLDSNPIDFTLTQAENYYSIHAEYTHSTHTLTINLIALPAWYEQPLTIAAIGGVIVVVIIALLLVRRRRAAKSEMSIGPSLGDKPSI